MNRAERAAVTALGDSLAGSGRPFVIASALSGLSVGRVAVETDASPFVGPDSLRGGSENLALSYADRDVRVVAARFAPTVQGVGDSGFISLVVAKARETGVSAYVGDGSASWSAVHRTDAARLLRLALEGSGKGDRVHAVAEEEVSNRAIAESIGAVLGLAVTSVAQADVMEHFGFVGRFFGATMTGSSTITRQALGWAPVGPTLQADIAAGSYGTA